MIIKPIIQGVVAKTAHPAGCEISVQSQIDYVQKQNKPIGKRHRVLVLGASSGFGLAARIAATFGWYNADTIGVSYDKPPSDKGTGTAGWFNNFHFKQQAEDSDHLAINIVGDAFSNEIREQVTDAIDTFFDGKVDLIVYSLATGIRPKNDIEKKMDSHPNSSQPTENVSTLNSVWKSSIKPINKDVTGNTILLEDDSWHKVKLSAASNNEINQTIKVMGGSDWESWIDYLINADVIAQGCKTIAFSYIGSPLTYPIYRDGTLGRAKIDLHQSSHALNLKLANYGGNAYAVVCKALVTKASVFIPALAPYIIALYKVMKKKETHEGCIEQMQRLFSDKLFCDNKPVDSERLIRLDEYELDPIVQKEVLNLISKMDATNFKTLGDYHSYKQEFLNLNGFGYEQVDYNQPVDLSAYI